MKGAPGKEPEAVGKTTRTLIGSHAPSRSRLGMSLTELIVVTAIAVLVVTLVVPAMTGYARAIKGVQSQQRFQQRSSLFLQRLSLDLTQSHTINFIDENEIRIAATQGRFVPDADAETGQRYEMLTVLTNLVYVDEDEDPNTIQDNFLLERREVRGQGGALIEETERIVLELVSPVIVDGDDQPVFRFVSAQDAGSRRNFVEMQLQVGDRTNPSEDQWDRITGAGYQGVTIRTVLAPQNLPGLGGS